ncbi:MAG TPA: ATP-binding protein [Phycisphaerae bacterium]|nr:ATP-binding protein [Phycisphaerae bacterium]HRW51512.1 ATP-binding protein [Phycisphaerae bacterium]
MKEIVVQNDLAEAKRPEKLILDEIREQGYGENSAFAIKLALEEAVTNAFRHGNAANPDKRIIVRYEVTEAYVQIEVEDEGCGFNPESVPDPTLPENIDRPHGRGIMLMRAYLDVVEYHKGGCAVRMVMNRKE